MARQEVRGRRRPWRASARGSCPRPRGGGSARRVGSRRRAPGRRARSRSPSPACPAPWTGGPGRGGRRRGSAGSSSSARSWPSDRSRRPAAAQRGTQLNAAVDGLADGVGQRAQRGVARGRPGAWLTAPPGASAIARSRTAASRCGPAEHRQRRAGRGRRAAPGAGVGLRQPGQQRGHLGVPAGEVEAGEGAGGVADGEVERAGHRAQRALDRRRDRRGAVQRERRPLRRPRGRAPRAPAPAARRPRPAPPPAPRAASPGTAGSPRTSPGTGSTSRNRRSPSPRSARERPAQRDRLVGAGQAGHAVRGVAVQRVERVVVGGAAGEPGGRPDREAAGGEVVHPARLRRRRVTVPIARLREPSVAPRRRRGVGHFEAWLRGCSG